MSDLRTAAQQALEALEDHATQYPHMQKGYTVDAITALRAALEQQAEPAIVKESLTDPPCPACGGGGLLPDPTWDWVRCEICHSRRMRSRA